MFRRIKHPHIGRFGRRTALAAAGGLVAAVFLTASTAVAAGATTASCTPGSGPNLAGRHLTSGDLSSYSSGLQCANLTGADLSGLSLAQANFKGATGVPPYSLYLLIGAGVILTLLVLGSIRKVSRVMSLNRQNMSNFAMSRTGIALARGLVGSLVVALGFHLFFGGLADEIVSSFGPPLAQTCSAGALCTVGVASGFFGLFGGVFVILAGFAVRRVRNPAPSYAGMSRGPMGAGPMFGGFSGPGFSGSPSSGTTDLFDSGTGGPYDQGTPWS
jgi:Pentapeptide repeats (8 copies)